MPALKPSYLAPALLLVVMSCVANPDPSQTTPAPPEIGTVNTAASGEFQVITAAERASNPPEKVASPYTVVHHLASIPPVPAGEASTKGTGTGATSTSSTASGTATLSFDAANKDPKSYGYTIASGSVTPGDITLTVDAPAGAVTVAKVETYFVYKQPDGSSQASSHTTTALSPAVTVTAGTPGKLAVPVDATPIESSLSGSNKASDVQFNVLLIDDKGNTIDQPDGTPLAETVPLAD